MIKAAIVDDEYLIYTGLSQYFDWASLGMEVIWTADNAVTALERCQEDTPDILLTDINMPELNGLDLVERLGAEYPSMLVIIISGYDDFQFARRAISLKVFEYLLKPIDMTQLKKILKKAKTQLESRTAEKSSAASEVTYLLAELMAEHLTRETLSESQQRALQPPHGLSACTLLVHFSTAPTFGPATDFQSMVQSFLRCERFWTFTLGERDYSMVLLDRDEGFREQALRSADELIGCFSRRDFSAAIGVGCVVPSVYLVALSVREAAEALRARFTEGMGKVFWMDQDAVKKRTDAAAEVVDHRRRIVSMVLTRQIEHLSQEIDALGENIRSYQDNQIFYTQNTIYGIFASLADAVEQMHLTSAMEIRPMTLTQAVMKYHVLVDILSHLEDSLLSISMQLMEERKSDAGEAVHQALLFIQEHYMENDLQLDRIAASTNMSTSYFCSVFKREMGVSCVDYLTDYRIQAAKELLRGTRYKIYEIAEMVGYSSQSYFNTAFKKRTGVSPAAFRARQE